MQKERSGQVQVAADMTMVDSVACPLDGCPSLLPLCRDKECLKTAEMELAVVGAVVCSANKHTHACMNTLVYPLQNCENTNGEPTPSHIATKLQLQIWTGMCGDTVSRTAHSVAHYTSHTVCVVGGSEAMN